MEKGHKKLIICVDIDNDLYEKAKVSGPLIGRKANYDAAIKLALADPEEVDSNVIFYGIKLYDELSKNENVELVTLTGDKRMGVKADREIAEQLERILIQYPASSCIFVSDGGSDEEIMPIIRSRMKIDGVKVVVMKQAKELEKTYFVILEKLKDPYYSKIILGIPALLILMYSLAAVFNWKIEYMWIMFASYLILKLVGIEDRILMFLAQFKLSSTKISSVPIFLGIVFAFVDAWVAYDSYAQHGSILATAKLFWLFMPLIAISLYIGKALDALEEKNMLNLLKFTRVLFIILLIWPIILVGLDWTLNIRSIGQFVETTAITTVVGIIAISMLEKIRKHVISKLNLENLEVISAYGGYIGKINGIDKKNGRLIVQTPLGHILEININTIQYITEDRVIVNY